MRSPVLNEPCSSDEPTPPVTDGSIGFFLSTTSGHLSEVEPTLRRLVRSTDRRATMPRLIFVGIDERGRGYKWLQAMPHVVQRLCGKLVPGCAREGVPALEELAKRVRAIGGNAPTIVERISTRSCTGRLLNRLAFACTSTWFPWLFPRCWTPLFDKNTVSYLYGLLRLRSCVQYIVHIDPDVSLPLVHGRAGGSSFAGGGMQGNNHARQWVQRAVRLLKEHSDVYAIHPEVANSPRPCRPRNASGTGGFACDRSACGARGVHTLRLSHPGRPPRVLCADVYQGTYGVHFTCQAFVLDPERLMSRLWPLPIQWRSSDLFLMGGPLGHVEALLERAHGLAAERGQPAWPLFVHGSELGVAKGMIRSSG